MRRGGDAEKARSTGKEREMRTGRQEYRRRGEEKER